jgi:pyruvate/2-oxoglutarate dehydrogenase complex dihydrolipoamide acyltransferase (E2) component
MGVAHLNMPQLGESVTEGTVDRWLKKEGDFIKRDEPIVEVVTDKVNAEIPSPFEGRLVKISVGEGQTVAIGVELAQIETDAVTSAAPAAAPAPAAPPAAPSPTAAPAGPGATQEVPAVAAATAPEAPAGERARFSPAVRRLAEEHGIDPSSISGSGENGRVTRDDVLAFVGNQGATAAAPTAAPADPTAPAAPTPAQTAAATAAAPAAAPGADHREELVRLSVMRRSIAEHMVRSLATSPHAWTLQEIDMTELVRFREAEKEGFRARNGVPLTYLPFVIQVVCGALREFPFLNSTWSDDGIVLKHYINIGVAVAIPDGLIVPVIRDADKLGFTDLVRALNDLVERARSKHLKPEDVQGGTFTLNNTGATGSVASQPIINQPQAAILTTEAIVRRPVVVGDGITVRHMMNMCLSFDHRILDGMTVGQFMTSIKTGLEGWSPSSLRL